MRMKRISVITINYNNSIGLKSTIESVINQNYKDVEYLVIDGGSNDESISILNYYNEGINFFCSEPDNGVYDAMNKGLDKCTGEFVVFMNSGDTFASNTVLSEISSLLTDYDFIYGDKIDSLSNSIIKAKPHTTLNSGIMFACHQSMIFRKSELRYDLKYKIYSDYDFVCKNFKKYNRLYYFNKPISIYEGGGISAQVTWQKRIDKYSAVFNHFGFYCFLKSVINRVVKGVE